MRNREILIGMCVFLIQCIILSGNANAAAPEGSASMEAKMSYYALYNCVDNKDIYNRDLHPIEHPLKTAQKVLGGGDLDKIPANVIKNGHWFNETYRWIEDMTGVEALIMPLELANLLKNAINTATGKYSTDGGVLLERAINKNSTGTLLAGSFLCSSEDDDSEEYLPNLALKFFNAYSGKNNTPVDMACNRSKDGVFTDENCEERVNSGDANELIAISDKRNENLTDFVTKTVFGNSVTGGSLNKYTALEKYYLYYETFTNVCVSSTTEYGTGTYNLEKVLNDDKNGWTKKGYVAKNSQNQNTQLILSLNGATTTNGLFSDVIKASCQDMAQILKGEQNSEVLQAFTEEVDKVIGMGGTVDDPDDTEVQGEIDSEKAQRLENCKNQYTLGWVICPIIFAAGEAVDTLEEWVDGFFE